MDYLKWIELLIKFVGGGMDKESSSSIHCKFLALALLSSTLSMPAHSITLGSSIVKGSMISVNTVSKSKHLIGEINNYEEMRISHIKALRGKYKDILTPSEEFAKLKTREIELEK